MILRIYKEQNSIVVKDNDSLMVIYTLPPTNWRVESKIVGSNYKIRFYNEMTKTYAFSGASFAIQDIRDIDGNAYVTPNNINAVTISELNELHSKLNLFVNTEGYLNLANNYHFISVAGNNEILIKNIPTILVGYNLSNTVAQYRYVKIHNVNTVPVQGTTAVKATVAIAPNSSQTFYFQNGVYLSAGLAITASTQPQNNATNDVGLNDIVGEIYYI